MFKPALASLLLVGALPAAGQTPIDFINTNPSNEYTDQSGGNAGQVWNGTGGTELTVSIDTTGVTTFPPGAIGAITQVTVNSAINVGDLSSTNTADYNIVFDLESTGFAPTQGNLFVRFRDNAGAAVTGSANQYVSGHNNTPSFASAIVDSANPGGVSASVNLADINGMPPTIAGLPDTDFIQFLFAVRATEANYGTPPQDANNFFILDNVGIQLVPEPASAALLAAGSLCLIARRRRTA